MNCKDITAQCLTEVCHGVGHRTTSTNPVITVQGTGKDGAYLDIVTDGYGGGSRQCAFLTSCL